MKGKGRSRQAILAAVTVLAAAQAGTAYASTGPASESGVQTGAWIQEGQDWKYQGTDGTLKTGWVKTESGWYYSQRLKSVQIKYPNPKKNHEVLVSFEQFDLIGM